MEYIGGEKLYIGKNHDLLPAIFSKTSSATPTFPCFFNEYMSNPLVESLNFVLQK